MVYFNVNSFIVHKYLVLISMCMSMSSTNSRKYCYLKITLHRMLFKTPCLNGLKIIIVFIYKAFFTRPNFSCIGLLVLFMNVVALIQYRLSNHKKTNS